MKDIKPAPKDNRKPVTDRPQKPRISRYYSFMGYTPTYPKVGENVAPPPYGAAL